MEVMWTYQKSSDYVSQQRSPTFLVPWTGLMWESIFRDRYFLNIIINVLGTSALQVAEEKDNITVFHKFDLNKF